jgi:hypothetical protein
MSKTGRRKKYRISVEGQTYHAISPFHQIQEYLEDIQDLMSKGLKVTIELEPKKAKAPRYVPRPK